MRSADRLVLESLVRSTTADLQLQIVKFFDLGSTFHDVVAQDSWS